MENITKLNNSGSLYIKNVIPKELAYFLTHIMLRQRESPDACKGDSQVPNASVVLSHDVVFETLLEQLWPSLETVLNTRLLPTYSYARLYTNGDELQKHTDRDACEISLTLQLGRSHHYAWPIYMGEDRYDLAEGDGIIYRGCDVEHWRRPCSGPNGYYSGQCFLHFVFAEGSRKTEFCDPSYRKAYENMFVSGRSDSMSDK